MDFLPFSSARSLHLEVKIRELEFLVLGVQNSIDRTSRSAIDSQQDTLRQLLAHLRSLHDIQTDTQTAIQDLGKGLTESRGLADQTMTGQIRPQVTTQHSKSANTTHLPSNPSLPMIGVKVQQATSFQCPQSCFCQCHTHSQWSSPRLFKDVVGALFAGYSRTPSIAPFCNRTSCSRHEKSLITVLYVFPPWLFRRVLLVFLCLTRRDGPFMSLRTMTIRKSSDMIFFWAEEGNLMKIQSSFKNGEASPFDVAENNQSLLSVGTCTSELLSKKS